MKKIIAGAIALTLVSGVAQAALWNSGWSGGTYVYTTGSATSNGNAFDITKLESIYGTDASGNGYYFRMTLAASATLNDAYMLNFNVDNASTGANSGTSIYIGGGLSGIDMVVDSHYLAGSYIKSDYHAYNSSVPNVQFDIVSLSSVGGAFEKTGTELEWFVPSAELIGNVTTVSGTTVNIGSTLVGEGMTTTYDLTDTFTVVPEPTSMALLAIGLAALGLRRKIG